MPDFNFKPAVTQVHFYRSQRGLPEDDYISEVSVNDYSGEGSIDIFELYINITLSGLGSLINPMTEYMLEKEIGDVISIYEPFYVNIVSYTQRGQKDTVIHGLVSSHISEDVLKKGSVSLVSLINKFRNDTPLILPGDREPIEYDNITNIYFVKVFYSNEKIFDESQLSEYMRQSYHDLFSTKIPLNLPKKGGYYNEG